MFQDVLLAEYHGTFHDTPSNKILVLDLQNEFGWREGDVLVNL
jgi:hypothetical protein